MMDIIKCVLWFGTAVCLFMAVKNSLRIWRDMRDHS